MKLKCQPEDFVVTERLDVGPSSGAYSLYRLVKTDIGTLEALAQIGRIWNLAPRQITHAGLKDRRAVTTQHITIRNGPRANLQQERFELEYLGPTPAAVSAANIQSNRFDIVVRQLSKSEAADIVAIATHSGGMLVPNYFDNQRFGSLGDDGEFVAAAWCRRDYERATWLALADANRHDRTDEKNEKTILRDHWGDWLKCKGRLSRSHRRSIVTYLVDHPDGFRRAFGLIRPELRGLYLSAFQSAVWNRMLGQVVADAGAGLPVSRVADADVPLGSIDAASVVAGRELPMVSARSRKLSSQDESLAQQALRCYDMTIRDMKVSYPRDRFFSRANRCCWLAPAHMKAQSDHDDLFDGFRQVRLGFELPRGSYATMVIRCLTQAAEEECP